MATFAPTWLFALAACVALFMSARVDARERRLPNALVATVALLALCEMGLTVAFSLPEPPALPGRLERVLACLAALALLGGGEALWRRVRGSRGLGYGDVKLLAALALWVGPAVVVVLACACLCALAVELPRSGRAFAFGPYLAGAGAVVLALCCAPW